MKPTATLPFFRQVQNRVRRIIGVPRNWLNDPSPATRSFNTNLVYLIASIITAAVFSSATLRAANIRWTAAVLASAAIGNMVFATPWFKSRRAKFTLCGIALVVLNGIADPREFEQWSFGTLFLPGFIASLYCSALDDCPPLGE